MIRIDVDDGRVAWFCGHDPDALDAMVVELFGDAARVTIVDQGDEPT